MTTQQLCCAGHDVAGCSKPTQLAGGAAGRNASSSALASGAANTTLARLPLVAVAGGGGGVLCTSGGGLFNFTKLLRGGTAYVLRLDTNNDADTWVEGNWSAVWRTAARSDDTAASVRVVSCPTLPRWVSIRFRPALRTYAPWGVHVVSLTKS